MNARDAAIAAHEENVANLKERMGEAYDDLAKQLASVKESVRLDAERQADLTAGIQLLTQAIGFFKAAPSTSGTLKGGKNPMSTVVSALEQENGEWTREKQDLVAREDERRRNFKTLSNEVGVEIDDQNLPDSIGVLKVDCPDECTAYEVLSTGEESTERSLTFVAESNFANMWSELNGYLASISGEETGKGNGMNMRTENRGDVDTLLAQMHSTASGCDYILVTGAGRKGEIANEQTTLDEISTMLRGIAGEDASHTGDMTGVETLDTDFEIKADVSEHDKRTDKEAVAGAITP